MRGIVLFCLLAAADAGNARGQNPPEPARGRPPAGHGRPTPFLLVAPPAPPALPLFAPPAPPEDLAARVGPRPLVRTADLATRRGGRTPEASPAESLASVTLLYLAEGPESGGRREPGPPGGGRVTLGNGRTLLLAGADGGRSAAEEAVFGVSPPGPGAAGDAAGPLAVLGAGCPFGLYEAVVVGGEPERRRLLGWRYAGAPATAASDAASGEGEGVPASLFELASEGGVVSFRRIPKGPGASGVRPPGP